MLSLHGNKTNLPAFPKMFYYYTVEEAKVDGTTATLGLSVKSC